MQKSVGAAAEWGTALTEETPGLAHVQVDGFVEEFMAGHDSVAARHRGVEDVGELKVGLVDRAGEANVQRVRAEIAREQVGHGGQVIFEYSLCSYGGE